MSVVIITLNEASRIGDCLASVSFADEIIVADTGSSDRTCAIAIEHGARVEQIPFSGFGQAKQQAAGFAQGEWILSLDADERVTGGLRDEISTVITGSQEANGYTIPRVTSFLGKQIRHGGWHRSRILRLYRKGKGRFTADPVHERIIVNGKVGALNCTLEHHTDPTFPHYLAKLDRYSTLAAQKIAADPGKSVGVIAAVCHAFAMLVRMYILKAGWRDGLHGALLAVSSAYSTFLRYIKAAMIRRGEDGLFTTTTLVEKDRNNKGE